MTGNVSDLFNPIDKYDYNKETNNYNYPSSDISSSDDTPSIPGKKIYVPLPFWFSKYSGLSLPLVALQYDEVEIVVQFKPLRDLYTLVKRCDEIHTDKIGNNFYTSIGIRSKPDVLETSPDFINNFIIGKWNFVPKLDINYIYLDNTERNMFAKINHEYLIEQTTKHSIKKIIGIKNIDLNLYHPTKEIFWIAKRNDIEQYNEHFNYTNYEHENLKIYHYPSTINYWDIDYYYPPKLQDYFYSSLSNRFDITKINNLNFKEYDKHILKSCKLQLNGIDRITQNSKEYFSLIQPFQHHSGNSKDGIYMYSFSLEPDKFQPSGAINLSEIEKVTLNLETTVPVAVNNNTNDYAHTYDVDIYVINYNILRIVSGRGALQFSN